MIWHKWLRHRFYKCLTASHDIKINDTAVGATNSSAAAKAVSINAISATTNVTASGTI